MIRTAILLALVWFQASLAFSQSPYDLTVGGDCVNPLGFHDAAPELSWKLPVGLSRQSAYQVDVVTDGKTWSSEWIESDQSTFVEYPLESLRSRQQVRWRVRVRDDKGLVTPWSEWATIEMGLLSNDDWKGAWIRPSQPVPEVGEPVASFRRAFQAPKEAKSARLYVVSRGVHQLRLNGVRVNDDDLQTGWLVFEQRNDSMTYDVTKQLRSGENVLTAEVGEGWYAGRVAWKRKEKKKHRQVELMMQLEVQYADGSSETFVTDGQWEGSFAGPIVSSSIYDGEDYDARKVITDWKAVTVNNDIGLAKIVPKPFAPSRVTETIEPIAITEPQPGKYVFDLGQNMVGWPKVKLPVVKDQMVTIRFAEMLNADGSLYTENYRSARSTNTFIPATTGTIEYEPHFTFYGFRYVEISGLAADVKPGKDWVQGKVVHTDLRRIGQFASSNDMLNRLQSNIVWGQRGNFVDIPTDCPQRDERLGWTGDAQVFAATANFNYDCLNFWKSWLESMRQEQLEDGQIMQVVPDAYGKKGGGPGWMDAAIIIPWETYIRTGDREILSENYEMMQRLVGFYRSKAEEGGGRITKIKAYGDWLQPYSEGDRREGDTPAEMIGMQYYAFSAHLVSEIATVLGHETDAKKFAEEAARVKQVFVDYYFDDDMRIKNAPETQTAYVLSLAFDMLPATTEARAVEHLVRLIGEANGHLRTGFLGTPYIVHVLDEHGRSDLAYDLLLKESYPSWLYPLNQGATTMWERWNSYSHESGFGNAKMNSFNHYAYGAIGNWMYERVAGLKPDPAHPGYKHFFVRPLVGGDLTNASARLETPFGLAASSWVKKDGKVKLNVSVPPNTTATIELPDGMPAKTVEPGEHIFEW